jgi:hypothetical protein
MISLDVYKPREEEEESSARMYRGNKQTGRKQRERVKGKWEEGEKFRETEAELPCLCTEAPLVGRAASLVRVCHSPTRPGAANSCREHCGLERGRRATENSTRVRGLDTCRYPRRMAFVWVSRRVARAHPSGRLPGGAGSNHDPPLF